MATFTAEQQRTLSTAKQLGEATLRPAAAEIDRSRQYPGNNLQAIAATGLMGLLVPQKYGGLGGSLTDLAVACEAFGAACASTAMCYLMHSCGCAVIAAKATPEQGERWLRPAARGEAIATLAFSERGTGAHFYAPELKAAQRNGSFVVSGRKSFVTSGSHAKLYPILVNASQGQGLDLMLVTPDLKGVSFEGQWEGLGMAGNSSISMQLSDVEVPNGNLIGKEGDGQEVVFGVVAPTFLIGLAAVNVGIAQVALDEAVSHAKARTYPTGQALAQVPVIQRHLAEMSATVQSARQLVFEAARAADAAEQTALLSVMQAKIVATEAAEAVTDRAMQIGGGQAYSKLLPLERYWRDAHAGSVMAPTNEVLKEWLGKTLAGLPLF